MITTDSIIRYVLTILCLTLATIPSISYAQPTNIIYILADDLGYGDVGYLNANSKIPTPHIDKLAQQGMSFPNAYTSSAVCTPTRYGIMTGRYAWRTRLKHGVLVNFDYPLIENNRMTVASMLKEKGYNTAMIGKWHLGHEWVRKDSKRAPWPKRSLKETNIDFSQKVHTGINDFGFDYSFAINASADMLPYAFIENGKTVGIPNVKKGKKGYGRPGLMVPGWKTENIMPTFTDKAVDYITQQAKQKHTPFFLYLPLNAPHTPIAPNKAYFKRSKAGKYGDFVNEVDANVGRILAAVEQAGIEKNTVIMFTSDNGPEKIMYKRINEYQHNSSGILRGAKRDAWEGGSKVPFIVKWPAKVPANSHSDTLVSTVDFFATASDIANTSYPKNAGEDSFSFLPSLRINNLRINNLRINSLKINSSKQASSAEKAKPTVQRDAVIMHTGGGGFAIRVGHWKYIDGQGSNKGNRYKTGPNAKVNNKAPVQLYNLSEDASEQNNLYLAKPKIAQQLKARLTANKASTSTAP